MRQLSVVEVLRAGELVAQCSFPLNHASSTLQVDQQILSCLSVLRGQRYILGANAVPPRVFEPRLRRASYSPLLMFGNCTVVLHSRTERLQGREHNV